MPNARVLVPILCAIMITLAAGGVTAASARAGAGPACGGGVATPVAAAANAISMQGAAATPTAGPPLQTVADVPLPGGASRFDYQSLDPAAGRLYIAHMGAGELIVFDTDARSVVGTVGDLPSVTGVLAVPELHRVYAAVAGDHQIAAIDDRSLTVVARLGPIGFPDGLDYAAQSRRVFVSDESGGGELVIDAATDRVVATIDVGGEAGNTHVDPGSGCVLVAVQSRDQLVAIDPATDAVAGRFDLDAGCQGPHGFTLDALARLAFVTCEDNATLLVVDLGSMEVTATFPVGDGPDVLAFDPGLARLYVASESGRISVFAERGRALEPAGELSMPHAHTVAVDPTTHLVYVPLEDVAGRPVLRIMAPADRASA